MADKIKKISINAFEETVNSQYDDFEFIDWRELKVYVRKCLTLRDTLSFVSSVVSTCFNQENGAYMPEIKDFAIRSCIVEFYTNISLPSNVDKRYDLLYHSDLFDVIMPEIDQSQFANLLKSIDIKMDYLARSNIEASTKTINELYASIDNLRNKFEVAFGNVNADDINNVISVLSKNGLDEEKIVNAIMKSKKSGK